MSNPSASALPATFSTVIVTEAVKGKWICVNGHITSTDPYRTPILCLECKTHLVRLVFQD